MLHETRTHASLNSPLIGYALAGLERCWLPEHGRWSHIYHLDGRDPPNQSLPRSDVFYTLNVLLGMSRVEQVPRGIDVSGIFENNVATLPILPVPKYAFGMALWAAAELKLDIPGGTLDHIARLVFDKNNWTTWSAQDLGIVLTGVAAQAGHEPKRWSQLADQLFAFLVDRYRSESHLFYNDAFGWRRRFSSFATQTYLTLACYRYGEFAGREQAIDMANRCAQRLIALQGPDGEWPWFFDTKRGEVVDFYEVYSVHQSGMAPAFLEHAERHNVRGAREALIKGFKWVFGENQLERPMLVPELQLTIRSQARRGELRSDKPRAVRAVANALLGKTSQLIDPDRLVLRLECRSYELGWILWSFGRRTDLPDLTHSKVFAQALA